MSGLGQSCLTQGPQGGVGGLFPLALEWEVIFHIGSDTVEGRDQKRESNTKRQKIHL